MIESEEIQSVLAQVKNAKRVGDGYTARCPAHNDDRNSLSIGTGRDGKLLLSCHAGCTFSDILARLDLPRKQRSEPAQEIVYPYVDESGKLLYEVVRRLPKSFTQRRPNAEGGYDYKLGDVRRVIYRLPEIIEAIGLERTIFIPEGEKDVATLVALGLEATTTAGGAGAPWRPEYTEALRGADVVILPDNDDPGRMYAEKVSAALTGSAKSVRTLRLPGLKEKGDVTDWVNSGGTADQLQQLLAAPTASVEDEAEKDLPAATCALYAPPPEPLAYVVDEMFIAGEPGMVFGDGGSFKTTATLHIASAVAGGYKAFGHFSTTQRPVLIVSAEDGAGVLTQRMTAMCRGHGWDKKRVLGNVHYYALGGVALTDPKWCEKILSEIVRLNAGFVMLDPYQELVPGVDQNSAEANGPHMATLRRFCQPTKAAVVLLHHAGKAGSDKRPIDRVRGSSALYSAMRLVYLVTDAPNDATLTVECLKNNRAEKLKPFAVRREIEAEPENRLQWSRARFDHITIRQAEFDRAQSFILEQIDKHGRLNTTELKNLAKGTGISAVDVGKAKNTLELLGVIDFELGEKGAKAWGRKQAALVAEEIQATTATSQMTLPGDLDACPATSFDAACSLPPPLGGKQAGITPRAWATTASADGEDDLDAA